MSDHFRTLGSKGLSIFARIESNLNLRLERRLSFKDFFGLKVFEIVQIWTKFARLERTFSTFSYLKHLQAIGRSFVTITKLFSKRYMGNKIFKNLYFSGNPRNILLQSLRMARELALIPFSFFFRSENFILFSLSCNKNNLSVKLLKSLCVDIFVL